MEIKKESAGIIKCAEGMHRQFTSVLGHFGTRLRTQQARMGFMALS